MLVSPRVSSLSQQCFQLSYNTFLSSKVSRTAIAALSWAAGLIIFPCLKMSGYLFSATALLTGTLTLLGLGTLYHLYQAPKVNIIHKVALVALTTIFFASGILTFVSIFSTLNSFSCALWCITTPNLLSIISCAKVTAVTLGYIFPATLLVHRLGIKIFSEIGETIPSFKEAEKNGFFGISSFKAMRTFVKSYSMWIPDSIQKPFWSYAWLSMDKEELKTSLLHLADYNLTFERLLISFPDQKSSLDFRKKCLSFEKDAEAVIAFCQRLEERILEANDTEAADKLAKELAQQTQNALELMSLFSIFKSFDGLFEEKHEVLDNFYRTFLKNDGKNPYRKQLISKLKLSEVEKDSDIPAYEAISHLMHEAQCKNYLAQLNIAPLSEGSIFTFQKELEKNGLGTLDLLKKENLFPLKGNTNEQEKLLINTLKKKQSHLHSLRLFFSTQNTNIKSVAYKILLIAKRLFIEISIWTIRIVNMINSPLLFILGFSYASIVTPRFSEFEFHTPNAESIYNAATAVTAMRQYAQALFINEWAILSGFFTARAALRWTMPLRTRFANFFSSIAFDPQ